FLLEAFKFGAPPHGGIAFGWDRIVSLLAGVDSIREVIAFPKSGGGFDPLTHAPAPITEAQRAEAGVDFEPEDDHADACCARNRIGSPTALTSNRLVRASPVPPATPPAGRSTPWPCGCVRAR